MWRWVVPTAVALPGQATRDGEGAQQPPAGTVRPPRTSAGDVGAVPPKTPKGVGRDRSTAEENARAHASVAAMAPSTVSPPSPWAEAPRSRGRGTTAGRWGMSSPPRIRRTFTGASGARSARSRPTRAAPVGRITMNRAVRSGAFRVRKPGRGLEPKPTDAVGDGTDSSPRPGRDQARTKPFEAERCSDRPPKPVYRGAPCHPLRVAPEVRRAPCPTRPRGVPTDGRPV